MDYSRFLTQLSKNRKPSAIRFFTNLLASASPELIFLAGGLPNPNLFPFKEAEIKLKTGEIIKLDTELMDSALQYGPTSGYPPLLNKLKPLMHQLHCPPNWKNTDIVVTPGSQDGLCKAIEMLISPNDYFIIQEPCYSGTLAILKPYSPKFISVECDKEGMIPESLKASLSRWNPEEMRTKHEGIPKVMYINPNATNPSGISLTKERREQIYNLACEYNLLILEDDPYYFIQFEDQENFPPSFLNLDVEGRVIRFDSFSKIISSGLRLGFATGPKPLIQSIVLHMQASVLHSSSLSQVIVNELLNKWTEEEFFEHTVKVRDFYKERRDVMIAAANKHLSDICEWSVPTGGMFLWIKVPKLVDTWDMILTKGLKKNVLLVPGKAFIADSEAPSNYMRASFSVASPEKIELGMKYLSEMIREEIKEKEA